MRRTSPILLTLLLAPVMASEAAEKPKLPRGPTQPTVLPYEGPKPPWPRRRRVGVKGMRGKGQGLIDLGKWPAEPAAPAEVDVERLARALKQLCQDWMPPRRPLLYAGWILESCKQFKVDPFLLASLIFRQSRCLPRKRDNYGAGLAKINQRMHEGFLRKRRYKYWVLQQGAWARRELPLPDHAFVPGNLRRARPNIYFAAALLSIYKQQCPNNDGAFGSVPHRHFVSHFIWGDRVKGAGAEDRVLRSRRRLLEYYHGGPPPAPLGRFEDQPLRCPLDGPPRKITSGMGRDRAGGKRRHMGIDFASTWGEPVRAVADGRVSLAGLDRKVGGPINVDPDKTGEIKRSEVGAGGLFVMVRHRKGLVSYYMHLTSYVVKLGQQVKAGELLGNVGKTGIKDSGAHLHFELRHNGRHLDPLPHLAPYLFGPLSTYRGWRVELEQRRVRRRRRVKRWQQVKARRAAARAEQKTKP